MADDFVISEQSAVDLQTSLQSVNEVLSASRPNTVMDPEPEARQEMRQEITQLLDLPVSDVQSGNVAQYLGMIDEAEQFLDSQMRDPNNPNRGRLEAIRESLERVKEELKEEQKKTAELEAAKAEKENSRETISEPATEANVISQQQPRSETENLFAALLNDAGFSSTERYAAVDGYNQNTFTGPAATPTMAPARQTETALPSRGGRPPVA